MGRFLRLLAFLVSLGSVPAIAQTLPVAVVPQAVPSIGGTVGYYTLCSDTYIFASTPQLAGYGCANYLNALPNNIAALQHYYYTATACPNTLSTVSGQYSSCSIPWRQGADQKVGNFQAFPISIGTFSRTASCASGISQGTGTTGYTCVGDRICPSGVEKVLTVFNCSGEYVKDGVCAAGRGVVPDRVPSVLSDSSCEYAVARPLVSNGCWQSSGNFASYCGFKYVSDGAISSSALTPSMTNAATAKSMACPASGCAVQVNPQGIGSDGSTGGTGTLACGGSGQFSCANGISSGTTSCGGEGLPVCDSSSAVADSGGGDSAGSAPVCGGPGLPACQVINAAAAAVCGGPGLPACVTDAAPVCGAPGLPACLVADIEKQTALGSIAAFFGGPSVPAADPVGATSGDLYSAGLDGGSTFSTLAGWSLPAHTSACPVASFNVWGRVFVIDAQCDLASGNLSSLRAVMVAVFAVSALILIMKA